MKTDPAEQRALRDEPGRAQGSGRRLLRERLLATVAGTIPVLAGFTVSGAIHWYWPLQNVPLWVLALPIAGGIVVGWRVRTKLWPSGHFA